MEFLNCCAAVNARVVMHPSFVSAFKRSANTRVGGEAVKDKVGYNLSVDDEESCCEECNSDKFALASIYFIQRLSPRCKVWIQTNPLLMACHCFWEYSEHKLCKLHSRAHVSLTKTADKMRHNKYRT